jgi:hypothetical protein
MPCAGCMLDGHGDTLAAIIASKREPCCGPGMSGLLPRFVDRGTVHACVDALTPKWAATQTAIEKCATFPAAQASAFAADQHAYLIWASQDFSWWTAAADVAQCEDYQRMLRGWQDKVEHFSCEIIGPKQEEPETPKTTDLLDTVKTVAIASVVIGGLVTVAPLLWNFVGSLNLARGRKSR